MEKERINISDYKLKMARKSGATETINSKGLDELKPEIYDLLPNGPDVIFEAAGVLETDKQAVNIARKGSRVNIFGTIIPGTIPVSPREIHFNEININASYSINPNAMVNAIKLMKKELVNVGELITHRFSLEDLEEAMRLMPEEEHLKIQIHP